MVVARSRSRGGAIGTVERSIESSSLLRQKRLCKYTELTDWQKGNKYILDGYVVETRSFFKCLESLTYMHNEIGNIYSHLIPGTVLPLLVPLLALLLPAAPGQLFSFVPMDIPVYDTTSASDYFFFLLFFAGFAACLSLSATYHTLKSHSERVDAFANQLDYLGIVILISTSMFGIIHFAFIDHLGARRLFMSVTLLFGSCCSVVSMRKEFRHRDWIAFRAGMFILFGLSSVLPVAYGIISYGMQETWNRAGLGWCLLEGVEYISGAVLYAVRVPEKWSPGTFDLWGHSHQIFHVLVVAAAYCHFIALVAAYKYAHEVSMLQYFS